MKHVYIVAEIGCNHNGSKELARLMVEKAKECGVEYSETLLIEDAETYDDLTHEWYG